MNGEEILTKEVRKVYPERRPLNIEEKPTGTMRYGLLRGFLVRSPLFKICEQLSVLLQLVQRWTRQTSHTNDGVELE